MNKSEAMEHFLQVYSSDKELRAKLSPLEQYLHIGWPLGHFKSLTVKPEDIERIKSQHEPTDQEAGMVVFYLYVLPEGNEEIIIGVRPEKYLLDWLSCLVRKTNIRFIRKYSDRRKK